jgi:O-antigen ligase
LEPVHEAHAGQPGRARGVPALELVVLVALPLLSDATPWGGTPGATWPALVSLPVWLAALVAGRRPWRSAGSGVGPGLLLYAAGVTGSLALVLLREHQPASPAFAANLVDAATRWFGAWSTADVMFPVRSAAIYLAGPLFFLAVRAIWREGREPRAFSTLVLAGGALAALVAVAQAVSGRGLFYESIPGAIPVGRAPGTLPDPNALASYLALVVAFGGVVWSSTVRRSPPELRLRLFMLAAGWGALLLTGLWVTGSRAGFAALVAIVVLAALAGQVSRRSPSVRRRLLAGAFAMILLVVGLVTVSTLRGVASVPDQSRMHRLLSALDLSQPSMTLLRGRPALWAAGTSMVLDEPVAGVGPGRFGVELAPRLPAALWGVATAENAHNYYLQAAAEIGTIGFVGLVLLLVTALLPLWRQRDDPLRRAALFGAGAWCITCLAGHPQLVPSLQLFFWGFLGMATAGSSLPRIALRLPLLLVPLALMAGRVGQEILTGSGGPAFYAAGLYAPEPTAPGEEIVRWTSGRAELAVRRQGSLAELRFLLAHDEMPVTIGVSVAGWREERHFFSGGWQTLSYWIPSVGASIIPVTVAVSPLLAAQDDARELGVAMAPLRWSGGPLQEPVGAYDAEVSVDGRRFRWTAGVACFPLDADGELDVELRADHPDLESDPLQVTLRRGDAPPQFATLANRDWHRMRLLGAAGAQVLCVQSSRTWNPRLANGSVDDRDLGVAVALPEAASAATREAR